MNYLQEIFENKPVAQYIVSVTSEGKASFPARFDVTEFDKALAFYNEVTMDADAGDIISFTACDEDGVSI